MASFKDCNGKTWGLRLHHGAVMRLKTAHQVDVYALFADKLKALRELMQDVPRLVDVCWFLIGGAGEGKEPGDPTEFVNGLDGHALERLADAFWDTLSDFFQSRKAALGKVKEKGKRVADLLEQRAVREIEDLKPEAMVEQVAAELRNGTGS